MINETRVKTQEKSNLLNISLFAEISTSKITKFVHYHAFLNPKIAALQKDFGYVEGVRAGVDFMYR